MNRRISVIGLGYVGLPVAATFARAGQPVVAFDIDTRRIAELTKGHDRTGEVEASDLAAPGLLFTANVEDLKKADFHIVTVPTPIDASKQPDLDPLRKASATIGRALKKGDIVVYESTVYPGVTEDVCIPELEKVSGLKWKTDFNVGYSPERINPGDKERRFDNILKIVSGDTPETLDIVDAVYKSVVTAGTHRAASIKIAEFAKVLENTQRDVNIALINEIALICDRLGVDTQDVLKAAGTKWNFLPFRPGLVGGHCIGVDPYYLTHKADMLGYHPQVILAGRHINDGMAKFVAEKTVKEIIKAGIHVKGCKVNVLGLTFKEDCPDLRNSKVADVITELRTYGVDVHVHDPLADADEALHEYGVRLERWEDLPRADAIIAAVSHAELVARPLSQLVAKVARNGCFIDVKSRFAQGELEAQGLSVWRL